MWTDLKWLMESLPEISASLLLRTGPGPGPGACHLSAEFCVGPGWVLRPVKNAADLYNLYVLLPVLSLLFVFLLKSIKYFT